MSNGFRSRPKGEPASASGASVATVQLALGLWSSQRAQEVGAARRTYTLKLKEQVGAGGLGGRHDAAATTLKRTGARDSVGLWNRPLIERAIFSEESGGATDMNLATGWTPRE